MAGPDERISRYAAEIAARVEALHDAGTLSKAEADSTCWALFTARDIDRIEQVASGIEPHGHVTVTRLNVADVRAELVSVDCHLQRTYLEDYAGYRISGDERFVEFGFRERLRERLNAVRGHVSFPARISGFRARFALVELRYAYVMVVRAVDELDAQGMQVRAVDVCVDTNTVVVGVESDVVEASRRLRRRFGPMVSAQQDFGVVA